MIIISLKNITKSYITKNILQDISLNIDEKDKIGLVGKNGCGKSTLLKIITKELDIDSGSLTINKDISIGYLDQNTINHTEKTLYDYCLEEFSDMIALEEKLRKYEHLMAESANDEKKLEEYMNIYSNLTHEFEKANGFQYISEVRGVLFGLGFKEEDFTREINTFSGGQQSRISIAKLLLKKPDVLLLDEPTNDLDINAIRWLESYLKAFNGTLILVSHDRYFLDQIVNKVVSIENHKIFISKGNYTDFIKNRDADYENRLSIYEKQKKYIKEQEEIIRKFKERKTEKLAKRAKSREKRLDMMESIDMPTLNTKKINLSFNVQSHSGNDVLTVTDLEKSFGDKCLFKDINFNIYKNDKIGLIGNNGTGKTTLLKMLLKEDKKILYGTNVINGYFSQDQMDLNYNNNLIEEISDFNPKLNETDIRTYLGSFLFIGDDVFKEIKSLSGGEKARLSLLKLMLSESNFLLLDEPTNHLDMDAKEVLESSLLDYTGTILSVSHDRYYLNKICNKIFELTEDGLTIYLGNYDEYVEKKAQLEELNKPFEETIINKTKLKEQRKKERREKEELKKKKKLIVDMEMNIEKLETEKMDIEMKLCDEKIYSDKDKVLALHKKLNDITIELDSLYEQLINIE